MNRSPVPRRAIDITKLYKNVEFLQWQNSLLNYDASPPNRSPGKRRLPMLTCLRLHLLFFGFYRARIEHRLCLALALAVAVKQSSSSLLASSTMSHNSDAYLILSYPPIPPRLPREAHFMRRFLEPSISSSSPLRWSTRKGLRI
jgi:hypothetical protein